MQTELDHSTWKLNWNIDFAYIKDKRFRLAHDIGILELGRQRTDLFFDHATLMNDVELQNAKIVPICLGASNLHTKIDSNTEIRQLGWGNAYEESPLEEDTGGIRDPEYSSCMTTQASPDTWRFQNCDMKKSAISGVCKKNQNPPEYDIDKVRRCKEYFDKAYKVNDPHHPGKTLSETRLKDMDFIYVVNIENGKAEKEKCFNPTLLSNFGWCFLSDFKEKHDTRYAKHKQLKGGEAWGICSPSCNEEYTEVNPLEYT